MPSPRRYYVRSPDGKAIAGYDNADTAKFVALEYGEGTRLSGATRMCVMECRSVESSKF